MKKFYLSVSIAVALSLTAGAQSKFDGRSLTAINNYLDLKANPAAVAVETVEPVFNVLRTARGVSAQAGVIITLNPGATFEDIEAAGLKIEARIGDDMCVASGEIEDIIALEYNDAVKSASFGGKAEPKLDKARKASNVVQIHDGTGLDKAYKGTGIICGIYDVGVDPNHINFYDESFKNSRVKAVYNFLSSTGSCVAYETSDRIAAVTTDSRSDTHGTHTLGCMAGAFCLRGNAAASTGRPTGTAAVTKDNGASTALASNAVPYYGTAPDADIVIGYGGFYDANIIAAVGKIVDYAKAKGQPCVVNLSIGSNAGSHDGTDAFGQAMERFAKDAIICVSSGNEGTDNISIVKKLTASDNTVKTMLNFPQNGQGILDIYGSDKNAFNFKVLIVDKTTGDVKMTKEFNSLGESVLATNNYNVSTYVHDNAFDDAFSSSFLSMTISDNATTTGRHSISMQYSLNASGTNSARNLVIAIVVEGKAGQRIDITNYNVSGNIYMASNGINGYLDGGNEFSINDMACSPSVLSIGSWSSRITWPTVDHQVYTYTDASNITLNEVSPFSSYGVTYDGRSLPDICAPGARIISSINSYYESTSSQDAVRMKYNDRTYVWQGDQGTSMSSPFVAGIIATWLQADPTLTVSKVREIIKETAQPLEGGTEVQRGAGKIDAYEGLKKVLSLSAVNDVTVDTDILLAAKGGNVYEAFSPAGNVAVTVYNISGQPVLNAHSADTTVSVDLSNQAKGIYLININGQKTERVAVN